MMTAPVQAGPGLLVFLGALFVLTIAAQRVETLWIADHKIATGRVKCSVDGWCE